MPPPPPQTIQEAADSRGLHPSDNRAAATDPGQRDACGQARG